MADENDISDNLLEIEVVDDESEETEETNSSDDTEELIVTDEPEVIEVSEIEDDDITDEVSEDEIVVCVSEEMDLSELPYDASGSVEINSTNFPDEVLRDYVSGFDYNEDNYLSYTECNNVESIHLSWTALSDLTGLSFFPKPMTISILTLL